MDDSGSMFEILKMVVFSSPNFVRFFTFNKPIGAASQERSRGEKHHKAKGNDHRLAWLLFRSYPAPLLDAVAKSECVWGFL